MKLHNLVRSLHYQRGASALFIVIFASIILSLIAVSFATLMIHDQGSSADDETSQGAYDAAMAGVEDGKRAIIECDSGSGTNKTNACNAIATKSCDTVISAGIAGTTGGQEVIVKSTDSSSGGQALNMAYTCVVVENNTSDFIGQLDSSGDSVVVPLRTDGAFEKIRLSWFSETDVSSGNVDLSSTASASLPTYSDANWPNNRPPIVKAQLIQYSSGYMSEAGNFTVQPYATTLYLYPSTIGASSLSFTSGRRGGVDAPQLISCSSVIPLAGYSCSVDLTILTGGTGAHPTTSANRVAYLRLSSYYGGANFQVEALDSSSKIVDFSGVQPSIDSTGRANDIFRRVKVRVQKATDALYPRATVDITGNLCKSFSITNTAGGYSSDCTP